MNQNQINQEQHLQNNLKEQFQESTYPVLLASDLYQSNLQLNQDLVIILFSNFDIAACFSPMALYVPQESSEFWLMLLHAGSSVDSLDSEKKDILDFIKWCWENAYSFYIAPQPAEDIDAFNIWIPGMSESSTIYKIIETLQTYNNEPPINWFKNNFAGMSSPDQKFFDISINYHRRDTSNPVAISYFIAPKSPKGGPLSVIDANSPRFKLRQVSDSNSPKDSVRFVLDPNSPKGEQHFVIEDPMVSPGVKIVHYMILGDTGVGKTTILKRLQGVVPDENELPTTELSWVTVSLPIAHVKIWDSSVKLSHIIKPILTQIDGYIIVADISKAQELQNCQHWVKFASTYGKPDSAIVFVGNKMESRWCNVRNLAGRHPWIETSALKRTVSLEQIYILMQDQSFMQDQKFTGTKSLTPSSQLIVFNELDDLDASDEDITEGISIRKAPDTSECWEGISSPFMPYLTKSLSKIASIMDGTTPQRFISDDSCLYGDFVEMAEQKMVPYPNKLNCCAESCNIF